MKIKYLGNRPCVSFCCTGRKTYYFGHENDYTNEVNDRSHATQILGSTQHRFQVVLENNIPVEPVKEQVVEEPKKKEKKNAKK